MKIKIVCSLLFALAVSASAVQLCVDPADPGCDTMSGASIDSAWWSSPETLCVALRCGNLCERLAQISLSFRPTLKDAIDEDAWDYCKPHACNIVLKGVPAKKDTDLFVQFIIDNKTLASIFWPIPVNPFLQNNTKSAGVWIAVSLFGITFLLLILHVYDLCKRKSFIQASGSPV